MQRCKTLAIALGLMASHALAERPSLCEQLAVQAQRAPAAVWTLRDPLSAWVLPAAPPARAVADALASDPRWRAALGVDAGQVIGVSHLAGTGLYQLDHFAGTAPCQSVLLVEARRGQPARRVAPPFDLAAEQLCVTQSARWVRVLGQPALQVGGAPRMASPDRQYRLVPWTGKGWGPSCTVTLRREVTILSIERFCAPGHEACEAGQPLAARLAQAHEVARTRQEPVDALAFNGGREPDAAAAAALGAVPTDPGAVGDGGGPVPRFGATPREPDDGRFDLSNADPQVLPVWDGAHWRLAKVGRSGVGWREGDALLVVLYAPPGRPDDALATHTFRVEPSGLRDLAVQNERR